MKHRSSLKLAPIEVAENTVTDTNIGAPVVAMDVDSGDTLTYMLDATPMTIRALFDIDSTTGPVENRGSTGL